MDLVQNQKWAFILAGEKFINKVYQKTKQTPKLSGNRERKLTDAATKDKGRAWVHTRKKTGWTKLFSLWLQASGTIYHSSFV